MGEFQTKKIIPVCAFAVGLLVVDSCRRSVLREPRDMCGRGGVAQDRHRPLQRGARGVKESPHAFVLSSLTARHV